MDITVRDYITLGQLLKVVGEIQSGGEVKSYLASESPLVNGQQENRRGRKLRGGDVVILKRTGQVNCVSAENDQA
jgi:ribosome-associated protein